MLDQYVRFSSKRNGARVLAIDLPVKTTWHRRILAILPVKEHIVYATEALLGAAMHGLGGIVANESPTGESQRYLARGWRGEPSRSDCDLAALVDSVTVSIAQRSQLFIVRDALLAAQLRVTQRLLEAGVFRGPDGGVIPPALPHGEYSLWQCISALSSREATTTRVPFDVVPYADFCGLCDWLRRHARPCKHLIFCRGLVLAARNDASDKAVATALPWWSCDTPMYLNFELFAAASAPAAAAAVDGVVDGGVEAVVTAAGLEDLVSALGELTHHAIRLVHAVADAVDDAKAVEQARAQLSAVLLRGSVAAGMPAGGGAPASAAALSSAAFAPVDALADHARVPRCANALRAAASIARAALGDAPRVPRLHGGGRAGPLDKSATSAAEVIANHRRLVGVPAPRLELRPHVVAAAAAPPAAPLVEARFSPRFVDDAVAAADNEAAPASLYAVNAAAMAAALGDEVFPPRGDAAARSPSASEPPVAADDGGASVAAGGAASSSAASTADAADAAAVAAVPAPVVLPSAAGGAASAGQKHSHSRTPGEDRAVRQRR